MISQELAEVNIDEKIAGFVGLVTLVILLMLAFDLGVVVGRIIR